MISEKKVVFIGGCPRSGTTMLGSMLGVPEHYITTPESHFKQTIPVGLQVDWEEGLSTELLKMHLNRSFRFKIWQIPLPEISQPARLNQEDYRLFLYHLVDIYAKKHGKNKWEAWIDHTPHNFQEAFSLSTIFPNAKFIHIVRDPRAVFSSVLNVDWGPANVPDFVNWWTRKISFPLAFQLTHPDRVLMVRFEDLLHDPGEETKKICDFSGLNYQKKMIGGSGFELPSYTREQHQYVGKKPVQKKSVQWKEDLDESDIIYIERHVGDLMALFGYTKEAPSPVHKTLVQRIRRRGSRLYLEWRKKRNFNKRKKEFLQS